MLSTLKKTASLVVISLAPGLVLAHHSELGDTGFAATLLHLLGEHGYLLPLLAAVGLYTWYRGQRG